MTNENTINLEVTDDTPAFGSPTTEKVRIIDNAGSKLVHIPFEPLRAHLGNNVMGFSTIPYGDLYDEDEDTEADKRRKDKHAAYPLSTFIGRNAQQQFERRPVHKCSDLTVRNAYQRLLELVKAEETKIKREVAQCFKTGLVTFDQLSMGLEADSLFAMVEDGVTISMKVKTSTVRSSFFGVYLDVEGTIYGSNGQELTAGEYNFYFPAYKGKKTFKELGIVVVTDEVKSDLAARGRRYVDLTASASYVVNTGTIAQRSYYGVRRFNANGRVMIDITAMNRAMPNYHLWFGEIEPGESNRRERKDTLTKEALTEDVLACMSPYVYGFSFNSKAWGELKVDSLSEVEFREDAYDKLVLDAADKAMILALVQAEDLHSVDLIDGKGGGVIFLLAGAPGGGKTLTAESVAEKLKRPLYAVGIGELGTDVKSLEDNLTRILETAATWKAVLLLDEADIFLEERKDDDIERNAMVAVFLRLLEYYQGILFLTSNRAKRIDRAFYSRISLALHYKPLDASAREQVWKNLLGKQIERMEQNKVSLSPADYHTLAAHEINGRQIKNVLRIGITLAAQEGRAAVLSDFESVIHRISEFEKTKDNH